MAAPVVASKTSAGPSGFADTSLSINKPTGVASGDLLVLVVIGTNFSNSTHSFSCSGFTSRRKNTNAGYAAVEIFDRIADGSEGSSFSISITNGAYTSAALFRVTGASSSPFDTSAADDSAGGFDADHNIPSLTLAEADELVIAGLSNWNDLLSSSPPSGWVEEYQVDYGYFFSKSFSASGATGSTTLAALDSDRWASAAVAYKADAAVDDYLFTGADGSPWGAGWTTGGNVVDINSNRGRMVTTTGGFDGCFAYIDIGVADPTIKIDLTVPTNDAQFPEIRYRFDSGNYDYIRVLLEPHNDVVVVHDYDGDVQQTFLDSASFAISGGDVVHFRIAAVGTSHKVRLWKNSDPEPGDWQIEYTSSFGLTNDQLMVRTVTSNAGVAVTNYWDNLDVSAGSFPYAHTKTETGTGADGQTVAATQTRTETGAGTDAGSVAAAQTRTDTGSGTDAWSLTVTLSSSETGAGDEVEAAGELITAADDDTGIGTDEESLFISVNVVEQSDVAQGFDLYWIRKVARLTALSAYTNDRSGIPAGADLGEGDMIARARSRRRG
jgi:hypothetical protein